MKQNKRYYAVMSVILIAAVVLLNVFMSLLDQRYPLRLDLTSDALFEMSEETKELVSGIETEVTIYVLAKETDFTGSSTYMMQANEMIKQYIKNGKVLRVEYVDYISDPTFASRFPDVSMAHGDILVVSGERRKVLSVQDLFNTSYSTNGKPTILSSKADQMLASAILYVTSDQQVKVSLIKGNGEYDMPSFVSLLENNNYAVSTVNLATEDIAEDCTFAVLLAPHADLSDDGIKKLESFLYNRGQYGKTLIYAADAEQKQMPRLEQLLRDWGVVVGDGAVFETNSKRVYNYHPFYAVADYVDEEFAALMKDRSTPMLVPLAKPLSLAYEYRNNNSTKVLLQFGESTAVRPSGAGEDFTREDATVTGPLPALVLASYSVADKSTGRTAEQSNILVSASAGMVDSYALDNSAFANSGYLINVMNSLAGKTDVTLIPSKSITGNQLNITTGTANLIGMLLAAALPLVIIAAGIGIWLYRRHQ